MAAIEAEDLVKIYGGTKKAKEVRALDGVSLAVPEGTILGLLGPNGAGKTTAVRVLTTLLRPDSGRATVLGLDVAHKPNQVRRLIGLSGQYAAVDENLTGRENLVMVGRLYHMGKAAAGKRAGELLEEFTLTDAADRPSKTYSGGMRRRLDLAAALVVKPPVIFLDEPTTGLDPRTRIAMWDVIAGLVRGGTTLLLTTQYLEEADRLADTIAVVDHGKVIARGTADQLKAQIGGERLQIVVSDRDRLAEAAELLGRMGTGEARVHQQTREVLLPVAGGAQLLVEAIRRLDAVGIKIDDVALRRPTLDDVFLQLTGRPAEDEGENGGEGGEGGGTGGPERPGGPGGPGGTGGPGGAAGSGGTSSTGGTGSTGGSAGPTRQEAAR
ncbi:daunorubicin resistance protein DrrA family ABC transporter ATP-binding protein [Catenulispora yoronensis]|uniref:Daunorubicin resistance protein DrrA family ABC transporter ATP-binding protein n=1 Tax=Catenulispora yoronensis TaxID=450799 RepID=A0ABN2VB39_9ACTN